MSGWMDYIGLLLSNNDGRINSNSISSSQVQPTINNNNNNNNYSNMIDKYDDNANKVLHNINLLNIDSDNHRHTLHPSVLDCYDINYSTFNSSECIQSFLNDIVNDLILSNYNENFTSSSSISSSYDHYEHDHLDHDHNEYNEYDSQDKTHMNEHHDNNYHIDIPTEVMNNNNNNNNNDDDSTTAILTKNNDYNVNHINCDDRNHPHLAATTPIDRSHQHHHHHHHIASHRWNTHYVKVKLLSLIKLLVSQLCVPPIMTIYGIGKMD